MVPDAWRQGDLSSLLARNIIIRDPLTGQAFPNNQIPVNRFSQFARNLFADETLYPRANVARPMSDFRENYRGTTRVGAERRPVRREVRLERLGQRQAVRALLAADERFRDVADRSCRCRSRRRRTTRSGASAANWNRIFGNSVVNDLLVGYSDGSGFSIPLDPLGLGELNNRLGIAGDQVMRGLTSIRWGNDLTDIGNAETGTNNVNQNFQVNERLTWLRGRHSLKFGGSWNYSHSKSHYPGNNGRNGFIAFNVFNFTGAPFADFLLDQVSQKGRGSAIGGVDAPAASHRPLRRGRLQDHRQPDVEPGDPLGLHVAVRRGGRPPGQLRSDRTRAAAPRGPERQQPRAL